MILVTKGFFLTKPNEFLIHTHIYTYTINNALLLFHTSRARIFRLHFVYTVERRSEGAVFATPILLLDGWMMVEMRPQAVARREKPSCDRIGVARVFASTSTHARTHARTLELQASRRGPRITTCP